MNDESIVKKITKWKPYRTRSKGRPRLRWKDNVPGDIKIKSDQLENDGN